MDGNMQKYLNNEVIGNVRTGTRGEKDKPVKLAYFDVHTDNSTSELAVEIFNEKYKQPNSLIIRFVNQQPMEVGFQRYEGKKLKCYGNSKEARQMDDKGKRQTIVCNPKECPYKKDKKCKMVGRLYFIIKNLEDEGVWCYPMGSEKGIKNNILPRIIRANRIKEDLTKDWYELYLRPEVSAVGINYIPDIRKIEASDTRNANKQESKPKETTNTNKTNVSNKPKQQNNNYLKIMKFEKAKYENKELPKIICIDTSSKKHELILMPESKQDILKVAVESIILPLSISTRGNMSILNDYNIVKVVSENKKAV